MVTISEAIKILTEAAECSPLGGDTVIHLCEDEREYLPFDRARLDADDAGAVFLFCLNKE